MAAETTGQFELNAVMDMPSQAMAPPGGAMPPMAAAPAPSPSRARSHSKKKSKRAPRPGNFEASKLEEPVVDDELQADGSLMAYGRLRMEGTGPARGQLRLVARAEIYLERFRAEGFQVDVDPRTLLDSATERARAIDAWPSHAAAPETDDGFDYAFEAHHSVDVPSDGGFHSLMITTAAEDARGHYVVVPRESEDVFRFVEMSNPLTGPILRGPADVYVAERYLLSRRMQPAPVAGKLSFGLGVEERIKVARNARFEERSAGLMGRSLELVHDIEIEMTNLRVDSVRVEVRDRVPVMREDDDDIAVHEENVSPAWEPWEPDKGALRGGRRWLVELAAGEKKTLRAEYVVRISAKHELVGGNRREQ